MNNSVLYLLTMSIDNGRLDADGQAREQDSLSTAGPPTDTNGLRRRLKRHFEQWSRLYVEQRVSVHTGSDD